jgi:hypothetical protein
MTLNRNNFAASLLSGGLLAVLIGNLGSLATGNRPLTYAGLFVVGFVLCMVSEDGNGGAEDST